MLIRELITRFGFDVDREALNFVEENVGRISASLSLVGGVMASIPLIIARSRQQTEQALGGLQSVGIVDFDKMESQAKDFSNRWAGISKAAFLESAYEVKSALANLSDEAVGEFTSLAGLTAKASKATMDEMVGTFTTGYGILKPLAKDLTDIEWAKKFTGALGATVAIYKTTGSGMAMAIKNLGATASAAQRPMEEQLATLGALQTTMEGGEAGTLYKTFIINAGKAGKALKLNFTDQQGRLKGVVDIIQILQKKFPDLSKAAATMQIQKAFGSDEALRFILQMAQNLDQLKTGIDQVGKAAERGTEGTEAMAESMNRGMGSDLLRQRVQNLMEILGKPLQDDWDKGAEGLGQFVLTLQGLAEAHPAASEAIIKLVGGIGILLSALGGLGVASMALKFVWPLIVAGAGMAATALGMTISAFTGIVAIIGAVLIALALLVEDFIQWVTGNKSLLGEWLGDWESFKEKVVAVVALLVYELQGIWDGFAEYFAQLWTGIVNSFNTAWGAITGKVDSIKGWVGGLREKVLGAAAAASSYTTDAAARMLGRSPDLAPVNGQGGPVTNNQTVNSSVNVTVPAGTPEQQAQYLKEAASKAFNEELDAVLREAADDFPETE